MGTMNLDWVVRRPQLALRVAIRSQRDRGHQFLRFMGHPVMRALRPLRSGMGSDRLLN
jgi:hypothetical protein